MMRINVLDQYIKSAPSAQTAIDLFEGEWSSILPLEIGGVSGGEVPLFDDIRIKKAEKVLGGFSTKSVLELGPLEGGHTCMLHRGGAASILAVEGNSRAFLKCLIIKELLGLNRTRFVLGDFSEFFKESQEKFDVCLASGVLYHSKDPVQLLYDISCSASALILWTHYYDENIMHDKKDLNKKFTRSETRIFADVEYNLHHYEYGEALRWTGFCGGSSSSSYWLQKDELKSFLTLFGFKELLLEEFNPSHPNGPAAFMVVCKDLNAV